MININNYLSCFNDYSYNNPQYGQASLHLIIGSLLLKQNKFISFGMRQIDGRTSINYFKPTFSGGSSAFDFVNNICKEIGIKIYSIDSITDAALLGTDEKVKDEDGDEYYRVVPGIMAKDEYQIIYIDEGSLLFQKNPPTYASMLRNIIQKALNPLGSETSKLTKKLAHSEIEIYPKKSMYVVSFIPKELDIGIVKSGTLQRPLTVFKHHDLGERMNAMYIDIDLFGTITDRSRFNELVKSFKETDKFIAETPEFKVDMDIKPVWKSYVDDMGDMLKGTSSELQENGGSFMSAYMRHLSVLSWHHAIMRNSDTINIEDLKYSYNEIVRPVFNGVIVWLEAKPETSKSSMMEVCSDDALKAIYANTLASSENVIEGEFVGRTELIEAIKYEYKKSEPTVNRMLSKLEKDGKIGKLREGKAIYIKVI